MKKTLCYLIATALFTVSSVTLAVYPEKPVSFVVPFPPGDLEDTLTRLIAERFQVEYGVAAAVVNKPGGGGGPFPGALEVANAPADGTVIGSFVIGVPVIGPRLGIDGLNEDTFEPLGIFLTYPFVLATNEDAPYDSMQGLAVHAKSNKVALGHFGAPLVPTKVSLTAAKKLGFEWGAQAAFDALDCNTLASGDADVINTTLQLILPCLDKVKILATITHDRITKIPNVPAMHEIVPSLNIALWNGLFVKKGTPQAVKDKIIAVAKKTVLSDKAQKIATETGAQIYWQDAAAATEIINADRSTTLKIGELLSK